MRLPHIQLNLRTHYPTALNLLALGAVLLSYAFFLTRDIDRPWVDNVDFNGAVWSQAAHNILRAGWVETQGASTAFYFGPLPIPDSGYYLHHPPLLHLGIASLFSILGEHEWVARILPIGCSLASVVLLWLLVADCLGLRTATFCSAVFVGLPMSLQYGAMVNFEPVVLMLILLVLLARRYEERSGRTVWKVVFYAGLFLGMWVDWAMHLFALVWFAWGISRSDRESRRRAWILLAMAALTALLYLLRIQFLRPGALQNLHNAFWVRIASDAKYRFTEWQWLCRICRSLVRHYLWSGLLAAGLGAVLAYRRRKEEGFAWIGGAAALVFGMDAIFVGVFQNDSYIHEYIAFYFVVPVSLLAGMALNELARRIDCALHGGLPGIAGASVGLALAWAGIVVGQAQTHELTHRFCILSLQKEEPASLIPAIGAAIRSHFNPATRVLCNFMPYYGPHLEYYACRQLAPNLAEADYWVSFLRHTQGEVGGVIWMGDREAKAILSHLPPGKKEFVRVANENFCFWQPAAAVVLKLATVPNLPQKGRAENLW